MSFRTYCANCGNMIKRDTCGRWRHTDCAATSCPKAEPASSFQAARLKAENEAMREVVEAARSVIDCEDDDSWIRLGAALDRLDAITKEKP